MIEAVLVDYTGPHTRMDWPFYFCTLQLDNGERVSASISDWDDSLQVGQRVRGQLSEIAVFVDNKHINRLERASPPASPSLLNRLRNMIGRKPGR